MIGFKTMMSVVPGSMDGIGIGMIVYESIDSSKINLRCYRAVDWNAVIESGRKELKRELAECFERGDTDG
jgi:hypothetical protein